MIPVKLRLDAFKRLKEAYPHLREDSFCFRRLSPYLGRTVYVHDFNLSEVRVICNESGIVLVRGDNVGVAVHHHTRAKTFNDYL